MDNPKLPGRNFIFVPSILLLIGVVINIFTSVPMLLNAAYWDAVWPIFIPWSVWYSFVLLSSAYTLFLAINGIRFRNILKKTEFLFALGIISLAIALLVLSFNLMVIGASLPVFAGLLLPILYVIGAHKNRQYRMEMGDAPEIERANDD